MSNVHKNNKIKQGFRQEKFKITYSCEFANDNGDHRARDKINIFYSLVNLHYKLSALCFMLITRKANLPIVI